MYDHCVQQLVEGCFAGYNATVLAYGIWQNLRSQAEGNVVSLTMGIHDNCVGDCRVRCMTIVCSS